MQLAIKIDFDDTYDIDSISEDLTHFQFTTITKEGQSVILGIEIETNKNQFLPSVFNLGFGPFKEDGTLDDKAVINHQNNSKVYSTILLGALTFLRSNPDKFVGLDGSDMIRAYLYYRVFQRNYEYLVQYFRVIGVKYYVRLIRSPENNQELVSDNQDIAVFPHPIARGENIRCEKLYNYFTLNLPR